MTQQPELEHRVALVTGAGHGIGAAVASRLGGERARVIVTDMEREAAERVARSILGDGGQAWAMQLDVADSEEWGRVAREAADLGLMVDTLVHSAFLVTVAPAHEQSCTEWDRQLAVNLTSVHRALRALWPVMADSVARTGRPASIVLISSVHAAVGVPGHPAYAATKAGLVGLARQLAVEYGPQLRVNTVLPGPIRTRTWDSSSPEEIADAIRQTTLGRMGEPAEVASAVAFLVGDDASFVSGATLLVDGGWSAGREGR